MHVAQIGAAAVHRQNDGQMSTAVQQINRNIELIRYRKYQDGLLLFELVNATTGSGEPGPKGDTKTKYPIVE